MRDNTGKLLSSKDRIQRKRNANGNGKPDVEDIADVPKVLHGGMGFKVWEMVDKEVEVVDCVREITGEGFDTANFGKGVESYERDLKGATEGISCGGGECGETRFGLGEKGGEEGGEEWIEEGGELEVMVEGFAKGLEGTIGESGGGGREDLKLGKEEVCMREKIIWTGGL